jgi:hypothetical protein
MGCLPLVKDYRAMNPLTAERTLDTYFLEARSGLLELAALLDRIGRGTNVAAVTNDPRLENIRRALQVLYDPSGGRAERIQHLFSHDYDPFWERPQPRYERS